MAVIAFKLNFFNLLSKNKTYNKNEFDVGFLNLNHCNLLISNCQLQFFIKTHEGVFKKRLFLFS